VIPAIVGGGVALFVIVGAMFALAWAMRDAEHRAADARVNDATKAGQIAIKDKTIADLEQRAERAERHADALDKELDQVAQDGDAASARDRVLARWARQARTNPDAPAGGDQSAVLGDGSGERGAVERVDRDGLERPGG
jgi:uncharacterized membrane protein YccC